MNLFACSRGHRRYPTALVALATIAVIAAGIAPSSGTTAVLAASTRQQVNLLSPAPASGGAVAGWGYNGDGELGNGKTLDSSTPVLAGGIDTAVAVAGGASFTLVVKKDGTVWAWGANYEGELGNGTTMASDIPVQVLKSDGTPLTGITKIAAGSFTAYALASDGTVWAWGYNAEGEVGASCSTKLCLRASQILDSQAHPLTNIVGVAGGADQGLAVASDGSVWAWGYNGKGELGNPSAGSQTSVPVHVETGSISNPTVLTDTIAVSAGGSSSAALSSDGTVWTWGDDTTGQLGNPGVTGGQSGLAVQVLGSDGVSPLSNVAAIASGESYDVALKADGTVWSWGDNYFGELGSNDAVDYQMNYPVEAVDASGQPLDNIAAIASRANHTVALDAGGGVWAWGDNSGGQLGNASAGSMSDMALPVTGLTGAFGVGAGGLHSLALVPSGVGASVSVASDASDDTSVYGQTVTFSATVAAPSLTPTGAVEFFDGTTKMGTQPVGSLGTASFQTSSLSATTHAITAVYTPDASSGSLSETTSPVFTFRVNPAPLTVTPADQAGVYGDPGPALTWTANFVNGDQNSSLTTQPTCSSTGSSNAAGDLSSPAGTYSITCNGAVDPNYTISYGAGTLSISTEDVTLTYAGDSVVPEGGTAHLAAILKADDSVPVAGRTLRLTLGSQSCTTGPTNNAGLAGCALGPVSAPLGSQVIKMSFSGDTAAPAFYAPATGTGTVIVTGNLYVLDRFGDNSLGVDAGGCLTVAGEIFVSSFSRRAIWGSDGCSSGPPISSTSGIATPGGWNSGCCSPVPTRLSGPVADPLAGLELPRYISRHWVMADGSVVPAGSFNASTRTFSPGAYPNGISVGNNRSYTMLPGTYVLGGGGLEVGAGARLAGTGVFIYNGSTWRDCDPISLLQGSTTMLTGPTSGAYANIVLAQDRSCGAAMRVVSGATLQARGSLYLPGATAVVRQNASVSTASSQFVVRRLRVSGDARLTLNQ